MDLSVCEAIVVAGIIADAEAFVSHFLGDDWPLTIVHIPHHKYHIPPQTAFGTIAH